MFQEILGFTTTPFSRGLSTSSLFPGVGQEELKARLTSLVRERGIGLITGELGSDSSTAIRKFVGSLDPISYPANPLLGISDLYRDVLSQLGESTPASEGRWSSRQGMHSTRSRTSASRRRS